MDTKTIVGLFCAIAGTVLLLIALFGTKMLRQKRLILAYAGICFYGIGALEYFGVVRLEKL